ncbi:lantibiotic dehydratase C-terminal domain-containing protein [Nesterenkonia alkaliphila]|uniref:Thiopeptide-type bacteriocin biosynthesis domain-containing protein n=1 Tax=Nesterenkonia alkaliphila TaxID=1463631 RepID=A0A7K1UF61_9MICC|nr:lantibiotic dehydratase C-terminal domain-containing protein [Nesterenkonia alkaliphila]MVT25110.1 hypothetical protein [Nesterenkonia alkaliphila]GFZ82854.1 hypothetical protein GCM10011359_09450 [Nesterenkonia alkaliphila]
MSTYPTSPGSEYTWLSLHLRCDGDTDEFLRAAVLDIAEELIARAPGTSWFYLRYWEGGPHVRLRLFLPTDEHATARRAVRERAEAWLADNNPGYETPEIYYDQIAAQLAAREGRDRPVLRWQPHGRVWEQSYEPETAKYGSGASLHAYERHFQDSSALAARVLRQRPGPTQVLSLAVALLLTGWTRPDLGPGIQSHDELVSRWGSVQPLDHRRPAQVRPELLTELLERARAGADAWSRSWRDSLDRLLDTLTDEGVSPEQRRTGTDICHHLLCNRLGLTLEQELAVRHSAWAALSSSAVAPDLEALS